MEKGIKEIGELIEGLELVGKAAKKISKDGKVDLSDLAHVVELVKESDKLIQAVKGLDQIDDEVKNLDQAEAMEILAKLFAAAKNIKEA